MFCVARELKARRSSCCYLLTITTTGDTDGDTGIVGQTPLLRSTFSPAWSTDTPWPYLGNLSKTYKIQVPELVRFYSQTHTIILTLIDTASYKRKLHKYQIRAHRLSATLEHLSTRRSLQFCRLETSKPHVLPHFCTCRGKNLRVVRLHRWLRTTTCHL